MGAIQNTINQGITTATVLGQISGVPELRKASKMKETIIEGAHRVTSEGVYGFTPKGIKEVKPAVESYINTQKQLFERTGKKKYLDEYNETLNSWNENNRDSSLAIGDYANRRAQEAVQTKKQLKAMRRSYLDSPMTIAGEEFGEVRDVNKDLRKQIRGGLRNGK